MNFLELCKASHEKMLPEWIKEEIAIPKWDEYFMTMAMVAATRSKDAQWKAGCILVKDNRIIGTGYNSWPSKMDDTVIPNTRPYKYDWVLHAEHNALANRTVHDPSNSICYTNGWPCLEYLKELTEKNIVDFVITAGKATMIDSYTDNQKAAYYEIVSRKQVSFREIKLDDFTIRKAEEILTKSNGV